MGPHVHYGDSDRSFDLVSLSKLVSLFWAFETQLNSIHPTERQNQEWAVSMRESSVYAMQYEAKYGRRPSPIIGVIHFLNSKRIRGAVKQASREDKYSRTFRFNQYNLCGIAHRAKGDKDAKATIEFRQHEGSMSAIAVVQWIKTTVGIVDYIQHIDNGSLTDLLRVVEHETWEKLGDGKYDKREKEHGPILAEAQFTIIHLLRHMQLYGPATFYNDRWRTLEKKPRSTIIPTSMIKWDYENTAIPESDEYKRLDRLREIWEENRIVSAAQPSGGWKFDPFHPAWPKHSYLSDDWDTVTNPSEPSTDGSAHGCSDDDAGDKGSAPIPNPPSISAPPQEPNSDLKTPDDLPDTAEGLDALEVALDKELEELETPYSSDNMKARDTTWRERVRDGIGDHKGIGKIPEGSMNPFGDSQPVIKGTVSPAVSPKTVPPQAGEENDGNMPSPSK
jgi:Putative amidoligase enzyme